MNRTREKRRWKRRVPEEEKTPEKGEEAPKGRQENYFFPDYLKTIRASSLEEAKQKIKEE